MDITIFGIAFNGYGKYVERWIESILSQTILPKNIIVVLGKNHNTPEEVLIKYKESVSFVFTDKSLSMGYLCNIAIRKSKTEWVLRVDIDDELLPHTISELIKSKDICDAIAIKFKVNDTIKNSPLLTRDKIINWRKNFVESGYVATKRVINDRLVLYDNNDFPNFPFLFKCYYLGMRFKPTRRYCVRYNKVKHFNPLLKTPKKIEFATAIIDRAASKYGK